MTVTDPNIVNLPLLNDLSIVAHVKSRWEQGVNTTPLGDRGLIQVGHSESTTTTNGTPSGLTEFTSSIFKTMVREQKDQALFLW